jgi:hypothetical protein
MDSFFAVASAGLFACLIYAVIVVRNLAKDNASLTEQLTKAQANDNRDPKSGRFVKG